MGADLDKLYYDNCCHAHNKFDKLELKLFRVFNLSYNPKKVINESQKNNSLTSEELFNNSNKELTKALTDVFEVKYEHKNYALVNKLERNIGLFSAYRSANVMLYIKGRTKEEQNAVLAVYERHLKVESSLVTRTARSAKQYLTYQENSDLYPNLEYLPSRSVDKRKEHQELYGIIKPVNDPFWNSYLPPNGWNCKCRVRQTDAKETKAKIPNIKLPNGITGNAVVDEKIFTNSHNSFNPFKDNSVNNKFQKRVKKEFEKYKLKIPYKTKPDYKSKNGSKIYVHPYADLSDLDNNYKNAKILADNVNNLDIKIRPHINEMTGIGKNKLSNPEYLINGLYADLKELKTTNIENRFRSAKNQGCKIVVFKIKTSTHLKTVVNKITGQIKFRKRNPFAKIYIIQNNKVFIYKQQGE